MKVVNAASRMRSLSDLVGFRACNGTPWYPYTVPYFRLQWYRSVPITVPYGTKSSRFGRAAPGRGEDLPGRVGRRRGASGRYSGHPPESILRGHRSLGQRKDDALEPDWSDRRAHRGLGRALRPGFGT